MDNIQIRIMTYDDISFICEADHDELTLCLVKEF